MTSTVAMQLSAREREKNFVETHTTRAVVVSMHGLLQSEVGKATGGQMVCSGPSMRGGNA